MADNVILKRQLVDTLEALGARQVCKQGKRVILKGVYNLKYEGIGRSTGRMRCGSKKEESTKGTWKEEVTKEGFSKS